MKKIKDLALAVQMRVSRHPEQTALRIEFEEAAVERWCLGLCLLRSGMIEAMHVRTSNRAEISKLILSLSSKDESNGGLDSGTATISLASDVIEYVTSFFLEYWRDGMHAVDHLDIELDGGLDLIFKLPKVASVR